MRDRSDGRESLFRIRKTAGLVDGTRWDGGRAAVVGTDNGGIAIVGYIVSGVLPSFLNPYS
jgi:hypothetical protein